MAVPKRKVSKARRDKRRSSVWKLTAPTLTKCTQCGEYKLPQKERERSFSFLFLPQKEAGTWR